nr:hypothetical protein [Micromonospora sp. DSM 115978]
MFRNQSRATARWAIVSRLHDITADHAGGLREGFGRTLALAELAAVSTDPDLLAEAAARHAVADNWYAINAVDLLLEAGADQDLIDWYVDDLGPADGGSGGPSADLAAPERRAS